MNHQEREAFIAYSELPAFKNKVLKTLEVIRSALAIAPAYVSLSWGKDSIVMLHLCQQVQADILAVNFADELQHLQDSYAEVERDYCQSFSTKLLRIASDGKLLHDIKTLTATPMSMIGCRADESRHRRIAIARYGLIHQYADGRWRCFPLARWKSQDVWAYTASRGLPHLKSYDLLVSGSKEHSRTAIVHGFNMHEWGQHHLEVAARNGLFSKLRITAPEYYRMYADLYPQIKNYG
jgi:phosphoadenosine phosphosulfate reductase